MNEFQQAINAGGQGVLLVIVILAIVWLLRTTVRAVNEYDRLVIFFIGRFRAVRGPGLTFVVPFVESAVKVDMRESIIDIPQQTAITKDNASIGIDFLVYYRITNPELSVTKVEDVVEATGKIATTTLRAVIGDIVLDDVLSRRDQINDVLRVKLDETTERWGMKITTVEIREIEPPRAIQEAMNRQMSAERDRRAEVTLAEGEKQAAIARAEGSKQSAILEAEGQKQSQILGAEGERQAQMLRAEGYAMALKAIYEQASRHRQQNHGVAIYGHAGKSGQQPVDQVRTADGIDQHGAKFCEHHGRWRGTIQQQQWRRSSRARIAGGDRCRLAVSTLSTKEQGRSSAVAFFFSKLL